MAKKRGSLYLTPTLERKFELVAMAPGRRCSRSCGPTSSPSGFRCRGSSRPKAQREEERTGPPVAHGRASRGDAGDLSQRARGRHAANRSRIAGENVEATDVQAAHLRCSREAAVTAAITEHMVRLSRRRKARSRCHAQEGQRGRALGGQARAR